ncbi:hypothetical protein FKB34_14570 [Glycocaulis profundi]|nr:hypothetical protein FKB34_14570 [Glycocaulis profundi]
MSIFQQAMNRIAGFLCSPRKTRLCYVVDSRIARTVSADIKRLIQDNPDGLTYRCAIAHWTHAERPPLARYLGSVSLCRIDGPLQDAPADYSQTSYLPLGGLIQTPGVTAHLTPFEAHALQDRIQKAIEREIVGWTREHRLYDLPPVPAQYHRQSADRVAMALIADWTPDGSQSGAGPRAMREGSDHV